MLKYERDAIAVLDYMERQAAGQFSTNGAAWPAYTTNEGKLEVRLSRGGFELWLDGVGTNRGRAVKLIDARMQSLLDRTPVREA